jgi:hypothetical protein
MNFQSDFSPFCYPHKSIIMSVLSSPPRNTKLDLQNENPRLILGGGGNIMNPLKTDELPCRQIMLLPFYLLNIKSQACQSLAATIDAATIYYVYHSSLARGHPTHPYRA